MDQELPLAGAVKTLRLLADGQVDVVLSFEPKDRVAVMQMMGSPGQPIACAKLKQGYAAASSARPKLGPLCESATRICRDAVFQQYASRTKAYPCDEAGAKAYLLTSCGNIESRKELDTNPEAARLFKETMERYRVWREEQML